MIKSVNEVWQSLVMLGRSSRLELSSQIHSGRALPQVQVGQMLVQRQMSTGTGLSVATFCAWLPRRSRATPRRP